MRNSTWLCACAVIAFMVGFVIGSRHGAAVGDPLAASRLDGPGEDGQTLYECLVQFAPERSEEIAAEIAAEGLKPDSPVDPTSIPPWSQVMGKFEEGFWRPGNPEREIRERVGWSGGRLTEEVDFQAPDFNTREIQLTEENVASLRELSRKYESELYELVEVERVEFEQALREQWRNGRVVRMPIIVLPPPNIPGKRVLGTRSVAFAPWHVSVSVYEGDWPAYEKAAHDVNAARVARSLAVRDAIARM